MHVTKTLSILAIALLGLGLSGVSAEYTFCKRSGNLLERATSSKADKQLAHHKRLWEESGATTIDEFMERVPHEEITYLTQGEHGIKLRDVASGAAVTDEKATSDPNAASKWHFTCSTPHTVCAILYDGIQYKKGPLPYKIVHKESE
ncbi:hypothetical protein BCV69DRAFT_153609 [Microstroma glucosiphilum]|uniref:Uncharacterized protein n=1 Tax=Pseudomicrostroma glucosiphilum TaxID=1684307 RepID=A0A316UF36_9BASI|nr:hypothetical protein BCV69DRAFT_153609 [Pseudomicrostroma glucosiphilum]PWN21745.1 hypothetical protein BCV69DRAFT_153609 [Pseudomicrostroma glucosiphilum]